MIWPPIRICRRQASGRRRPPITPCLCPGASRERREEGGQACRRGYDAIGHNERTQQILLARHLKHVRLPTILREYDKVAREAAREGLDHKAYLLRLIELELIHWERRVVERRIRRARFPRVKSLDTFDFAAILSLNKMLVLHLARCEYRSGGQHSTIVAPARKQPPPWCHGPPLRHVLLSRLGCWQSVRESDLRGEPACSLYLPIATSS